MSKRFLSLFMTLMLCFSMLQPTAFAEDAETETVTMQEQEEQQEQEEREEQEEQEPPDAAAEQETQEPDAPSDETEPKNDESLPSLQSNEENEIALQSAYDVASVGGTNYVSLESAFAAAAAQGGGTIKLLKNVTLDTNIKWQVDANVTLDTNGYSITANYDDYTDRMYYYYTAPDITIEEGKLTIVSSAATSEKLYIKFCIRYGKTLEVTHGATKSIYYIDIADTDSKLICTTGTISELSLIHQQGFDVTLADDKGNYCTIADEIHTFSTNDKVEELLSNHPGCALYSDEGKIKCGNTIQFLKGKNFRVAKCDEHDRGSAFSSTKCQYCGTDMLSGLVAENVSKGWYHETFSEALSNASADNTIKLRKNITDDFTIDKNITINPNYYNVNAAVTVNSGKTLTLGGAGTIDTVQVNGALDIQHDALTVKELTFASAPTPTTNLSHGEFGKFDVSKTGKKAYEFLAEGYAFSSTAGGNVVNGYVDKLTDVKIVSHSHDMSTGACACGLSCSHPNGFDDDDKCPDCGAHLAASVYNQSQGGDTTKYFNLQDAIDSMNDTNIFDITLLDDANGSYTVTKSRATKFVMNDKTINEITISGDSSVAFNTGSKVTINKVTFRGEKARLNAGNEYVKIGKLTIADGATWSSILQGYNDGYCVSDGTTKKWYDRDTAGDMQSMDNVIVKQLPVKSDPQLKIGGADMADETTVIFSKPIELAFTATVHNGQGGDGKLYIQKEGDPAPTPINADGADGSYTYTIPAAELQPAVYKIWAEVSKNGYTRTGKKHTLNVVEKLVPTGNPNLSNNGTITYGEKVENISLTGDMYDSSDNTAVTGTFVWAAKDAVVTPDAGSYEAEWIFTPTDTTTYSSTTGTAQITVNKADIPDSAIMTVPTAIKGLKYKHGDNTPQVLHTEGTVAEGYGTIKYTAANPETATESDWQDTPISMVDAGDYAIYYKVSGNSNHNDSKSYKIEDCHIEKYGLFYTVKCKDKPYDGTTDAEVESVKFQVSGRTDSEEIKLTDGVDYEIKNLKYESPDPKGYLGYDRVYATCDITLKDTPAARNYKLAENGDLIYGYIRTTKFPDFEAHDYEFELRYNDMTGKRFGATAFGAPNDEDYEISSDGVAHEGSSPEMFKPAKISRSLNSDGTCTFYIRVPLDESYIGKVFVEKMRMLTKDNKYGNDPDGEQTLSVIIRIVDKATPVISSGTIAAIYDGQPLSAERIAMYATATYNGADVDGTWSWKDGKAPTNVDDNGKYTIVFTPSDTDAYHPAEKEVDVSITPCRTEPTTAALSKTTYDYDGNEKKPSATVIVNGKNLTEGEDYEIAYTNNKNAGTATATITGKGNYGFAAVQKQFTINKANVKVSPKDITKTYGSEPKFALESDSDIITDGELAELAAGATFTSDGAAKTAPVIADGYGITVSLSQNETDNLIFTVGTGKLTVEKALLTITVNNVSREYGAANPELTVIYDGFVDGEDESVLEGVLSLVYENIDETTSVGPHPGAAKASGLTSKNYSIDYKPGNVTITKIAVNASAGTANSSYLGIVFDRALQALSTENFAVKDDTGNAVAITNVSASADGMTYTLGGVFEYGKKYTVKITLRGADADETHQISNEEIELTPVRSGRGGSSKYTMSFETNGGSKVSKQTAARNSVIKEPTAPVKDGFDFAGWYTDKELKNKYDFSAKVSKSMTLYAAWTEKDDSINQIILIISEKSAQVFGQTKTNDVAPKIVNNRTMLPARFVAESLGAYVSWNGEKELVTVVGKNLKTNEDITILIYIGSDIAYVNNKEVKLDSAAFVENDRTYTPIRFISEELGASVEWIEDEQKVVITK